MSGLLITRTQLITLQDSEGRTFQSGDPIMLRIKGEDIVCRYKELSGGYFVTETLDGMNVNKYRHSSIESCVRISGINPYQDTDGCPAAAGSSEISEV